MSHQLYRLGRACFQARRRVLAGWLLILLLVGVVVGAAGTNLDEGFSIPGTPAQDALEDLEKTLPESAGGAAQIVLQAETGSMTDEAVQTEVRSALSQVAAIEGVAAVTDPYTGASIMPPGVEAQAAPPPPEVVQTEKVSEDGSTIYSQVQFDDEAQYVPDEVKDNVVSAFDEMNDVGVSFGGEVFKEGGPHLSIVEVLGVLVALIVLALTFRSIVAAFLPIGTAILGVAVAAGCVLIASNAISVPTSGPTLA